MSDPAEATASVRNGLAALESRGAHPGLGRRHPSRPPARLKAVNERLWVIGDDIRLKERRRPFDAEFVRLARSVW